MRAHEFLDRASELVKGDRERQHGDKLDNFENIAAVWEGAIRRIIYMKCRIHVPQGWLGGEHVGDLMECLKVARRWEGELNDDDAIDAAGYAGCSGEIRSRKMRGLSDQ